ncbi:MAG: ATP-binding cassette domain-containing protein [Planctomycetota bacterium]
MTEPVFELQGVCVELGAREVLRGVDLRVEPGEAVALVGPSGAGKTTLLRVLGGSLVPARGQARIHGADLAQLRAPALRALRSRLGFVHQDHSLVPVLRVAHNVLSGRLGRFGFLAGLRSVLFANRAELAAVHAILERVGVGEKLFQRTDTLSGGQQQRVAIARALYQDPAALLADEPVAAVDPARARDLVALLTALAREQGLTLVASLHDLDLAREFFPRLVALRAGEVVCDGPAATLDAARAAQLYRLDGLRLEDVDA